MKNHPSIASTGLAEALTVVDLFVPGAAANPLQEAVSAPMLEALWPVNSPATNSDLLHDTCYAAAWVLLRARWLGSALDHPAATVGEWLKTFDEHRRAAHAEAPFADIDALRIDFDQQADCLRLRVSASLMDASTAKRLLEAVADTAADLAERPNALLTDIRTLPRDDRFRQLTAWNTPPTPYDRQRTVQGTFAEQVDKRGEAIALVDGHQHISYRDLDQRSDLVAHQLQAQGIRAGDAVGVMLDRSATAVVVLLAVLKAGAVYVPVQVDFPVERIGFMLADAGVRLVVTSEAGRERIPAGMAILVPVHAGAASLPALAPVMVDGDSVAYVMYTSGSTGQPKGIEICHRSILRLVVNARYVDLASGEAMLHAAPLGFDASTLEIWGPLLNGGVCVVHDEAVPTGAGLARTIEQHAIRTAWLTAALFNAVVDDDPALLGGLHQLLIGGEALSVPHVRRALAALPTTRIINGYGPTECTTFAATHCIAPDLPAHARSVPIGKPINDTTLYVLSPDMALLPTSWVGELYIGGRGLARGYLNRPELTHERFVPDPFANDTDARLYRTGDRARWLDDGTIEFIGRADHQVKIRGHRIEPGEIEAALLEHPGVRSCAVLARPDAAGRLRLIAYLVGQADDDGHGAQLPWSALRTHLATRLPEAMWPAAQVWLDKLPVTTNGKLDRAALPEPQHQRPDLAEPFEEARNAVEQQVCAAFARVLELDQVGRNDNFFELGGDSLRVLVVLAQLQQGRAQRLSTNLLFRQPTPRAIALELAGKDTAGADATRPAPVAKATHDTNAEPIALIAMAGRFPGAADIEQFWDNLVAGRESISFFSDAELDAGVSAASRADPAYVRARGVIDGIEDFDAAFFGINPKEAELMDPQQRVFLEICWECLERAGYVPDQCDVPVGVYGGMYNASYFQRHVLTRPDLIEAVGEFQVMLANEKDYITTRVAHRLNLRGPAISIHTACSTSLVAVAQAFHALRTGQCDMALAGGASVTCPPRSGYLYQEGSMLSPDGHTRSFDANAQGTVFSDGAAVVLLKRLSDALADGDTVYAVLRGVAVNNDGGAKASFTAPGVEGQAAVIGAALASAGVDARQISYVEAHGTATPMGDPIEVEALTQAYARHTGDLDFCAIGSVKSNVGHMVTAAGAAGLIKTALALYTQQLPASLHYDAPNAAIDFAATPFHVNAQLQPWPRTATPRLAGVSAFGVGGTNAHVIVEEAPLQLPSDASTDPQLLVLSARTPTALTTARARLADHLERHPHIALPDVAHTLRVGRKTFAHRTCVVANDVPQAIAALRGATGLHATGAPGAALPQPVLMFPGQGAQYAGMGRALYASEPVFRAAFDDCLRAFDGALDVDLRERMFSDDPAALVPTSITQPATFAIEYALARQALALELKPVALIGHSVGEFVAAVLAGVMRLSDAARLVARRGALMQALPPGAMLSVRLSAAQLQPRLGKHLSLAAENAPNACVAAGPSDAIQQLSAQLEAEGIAVRLLQTSHAFHSAMMDAAVAPFEALVREVELKVPTLPIHSTLTGRRLTDSEAADPRYWARHLRETVRFSTAVRSASADHPNAVFIEVGPRQTLATMVRQHTRPALPAASRTTGAGRFGTPTSPALPAVSLLHDNPIDEPGAWRLAAGRLWTQGVELSLTHLDKRARKLRLRLPTSPFERKRCWVDIAAPSLLVLPALPVIFPESNMPAAAPSLLVEPPRRAALALRLRNLVEDISGIDMAGAEGDVPFVELGLDSLTLTQVATQVKKSFKVNLSFRQVMQSYRSFDALAEFLDITLPADPVTAPAPTVAPVAMAPVAQPVMTAPALSAAVPVMTYNMPAMATGTPIGGPGALVQQVIAQQMQLMQQQLALLSGAPSMVIAPVATPVMPSVEAPPVAVAAAIAPVAPVTASEPEAVDAKAPMRYDVKKAFGAIARIHTQSKEPSERQKVRLATFMRRYVERTQKSRAFTEANRAHMADPRVVNGFRPVTKEITYQIVIERSKGSRMWDIDGNEYVDALNGFGMSLFGWQPDFVNDAVRRQLDLGYEIGPQHPLAADVTRSICELTGFDRAGLCNTGSEAVMAAIRIARTVTGRSTVVLFTGSYHGTFDEVLVRAGRNAKGLSAAPGIMSGAFGDVRVLDYGTPESLEFIRANADDLAAVLVEPVQSRRPDFQPREFLREVRAITEVSETCLIFDEVITGFRAHLGGAQAIFGVRADLACYGKVIGGGFPVGVVAGKRSFMDALDGGAWQYGDASIPTVGVTYFAGTFVRHPLALAACKASLDYLAQAGEGLQTQLNVHTAALADELSAWCREVGAPLEIRYFASLWRIHWLEDHPLQDLLFAMMRSRGVHILDNFPCFLTTAHSQQDIASIKSAFKESVAEMQEADFLPRRNVAASTLEFDHPPAADARLGRDRDGQPAWFVPDPSAPGKFMKVQA
jgi:amino acid adenylation domain-containing protein